MLAANLSAHLGSNPRHSARSNAHRLRHFQDARSRRQCLSHSHFSFAVKLGSVSLKSYKGLGGQQ